MNTTVEIFPRQVDLDSWDTILLKEIIYFSSDTYVPVPRVESYYTTLNGVDRNLIKTKGWYVQVKWDKQINDWVTLHIIKE